MIHHHRKFRSWATGPCFWCGQLTFRTNLDVPHQYTRDHLIPRRLREQLFVPGNRNICLGTVTSCNWCNNKRGCKHPRAFVEKHLPHRIKTIKWYVVDRAYEEFARLVNAEKPQAAVPVLHRLRIAQIFGAEGEVCLEIQNV